MVLLSAIIFYLQSIYGVGNVTPAEINCSVNSATSCGVIVVTDQQVGTN